MYEVHVGSTEGRFIGNLQRELQPRRGDVITTDEGDRVVIYVIGKKIIVEGREPDPSGIMRGRRRRDAW